MILTDYLIIIGVLISAVAGALRGFLRESVALGTWIVALFVAWHFSDLLEPYLGGLLADSEVRLSIFSGLDRLLGFGFGILRGFLLLGVFVILGQLLQLPAEGWWRHSLMIPYGESIANGLRSIVGEPHVAHGRDQRT